MLQEKAYTLRMDTIPFLVGGDAMENLPMQVHLHQSDSFDELFLKLYTTPVAHFDKDIAWRHGLSHYIREAIIYSDNLNDPLMHLERSTPSNRNTREYNHLPNATIYLNKGESETFLTPALRKLFAVARLKIDTPGLILAQYDRGGFQLVEYHRGEKDILYAGLKNLHSNYHLDPFVVETRAHAHHEGVPAFAKDGTVVIRSVAQASLRDAFQQLLAVDPSRLDVLLAYNNRLPESITSTMIKERASGNNMIEMLYVMRDNSHPVYPESGVYLHFHSPSAKYLAESLVPEIREWSTKFPDKPLLIAQMDHQQRSISYTETANTIIRQLGSLPKEEQLRRPFKTRTIGEDKQGQGPSLH